MTMPGDERAARLGAHATAICMGFDAMRIALGMRPVNFTYQQVMQWLMVMKP